MPLHTHPAGCLRPCHDVTLTSMGPPHSPIPQAQAPLSAAQRRICPAPAPPASQPPLRRWRASCLWPCPPLLTPPSHWAEQLYGSCGDAAGRQAGFGKIHALLLVLGLSWVCSSRQGCRDSPAECWAECQAPHGTGTVVAEQLRPQWVA